MTASVAGGRAGARRVVAAVLFGTPLNPLNSSMIAVALVPLARDFHAGLTQVTWLVSAFYLASAIGQPLMGRLADRVGAKRVFMTGLGVVGVTSLFAPLAPTVGWLIAVRVVLSLGTAAAYPAGLAMIRRAVGMPGGRPPAGILAGVAVAASVSAAFGPTLGGVLLGAFGWPAIFLVNVPVTLVGIGLAARWLPNDPPGTRPSLDALAAADLPGALLFGLTLAGFLAFLLSLRSGPDWWLLAVSPAAAAGLVWRELRVGEPFFDLRALAASPRIPALFLQFAMVTFAFYSIFFLLPIWFEQVRGFDARTAGLLLLPVSGLGVLTSPVAARVISRAGARPALLFGSVVLTGGAALLLSFGGTTSPAQILVVGVVLGVPNAFNTLALSAALYEVAPADRIGTLGGQFQTFRYVGAILSTSLLGITVGAHASTAALHATALTLTTVGILLVALSATFRRPPAPGSRPGAPRTL